MTPAARSKRAPPSRPAPRPSEVAPGVFVGGWKEAVGFAGARVCVLDERPSELDGWSDTAHVPIYDPDADGPIVRNLDRVAALVHEARALGRPALVFCGHGVRRGSLGGAWYLHRFAGLTLAEAFDRVAAARPQIERPVEWMQGRRALEPDGGVGARPAGRRSK